ncbi:unnamed protein product [Paramecium sonneborni]|uniref:Uncharacterized protein n=1 Tax=Paramecium sonneborni TaxID=65129 RepID=A0A8S1RPH8_9CILI|nr:unnamed protein product [Paramecium sonneborni]
MKTSLEIRGLFISEEGIVIKFHFYGIQESLAKIRVSNRWQISQQVFNNMAVVQLVRRIIQIIVKEDKMQKKRQQDTLSRQVEKEQQKCENAIFQNSNLYFYYDYIKIRMERCCPRFMY